MSEIKSNVDQQKQNENDPVVEKDEIDTKQEEDEVDEEGFQKGGYDIVICGTSLLHSILACALSLAGKTVLHCDGNFHYGDVDAVFHLVPLLDFCRDQEKDCKVANDKEGVLVNPRGGYADLIIHSHSSDKVKEDYFISQAVKIGMEVMTSYGRGVIVEIHDDTKVLSIELPFWKLANGKNPIAYIPPLTLTKNPVFSQYENLSCLEQVFHEEAIQQSRKFALDLSSKQLLYANGVSVSGLISSGVASYVEFQALQNLYLFHHDKLIAVPCSKANVFQSKDLSPLEKRKIMKLSQFAMDYGLMKSNTEVEEDEEEQEQVQANTEAVTSLNEHELKSGRSLIRPQNKPTLSSTDFQKFYESKDDSFVSFLQSQYKLSEKLCDIVQYVLALNLDSQESLGNGMEALFQHLKSLGKYGDSAFLACLYGSGELSQSFCRSSAVYGGISLLRRCPLSIVPDEKENRVKGVWLASDPDPIFTVKTGDKFIACEHVIVSANALQDTVVSEGKNKRILRRLSIIRCNNTLATNEIMEFFSRSIITFPPTESHSYATQCLVLDSAVHVAPIHYFVVHLTTFVDDFDGKNDKVDSILKNTLDLLLSSIVKSLSSITKIYEVHHACYSILDSVSIPSNKNINGMHVTSSQSPTQYITIDESFIKAQEIFKQICPNSNFLSMSEEMNDKITALRNLGKTEEEIKKRKEEDEDAEDAEKELLDSALQSTLLDKKEKEDEPNVDCDSKVY